MAKEFAGKRVTVDLPPDLWERFQSECGELGWSLKRAVAAAMWSFLRDYGDQAQTCYRDVYANWPLKGGHHHLTDKMPTLAQRGGTAPPADDEYVNGPADDAAVESLGDRLDSDRAAGRPRKRKSG